MIGLHCDTCDRPLVLTARVADGGDLIIDRHPYTECICPFTPTELLDLIDDSYTP